jgi:hypothetical protein
MRESVVPEKARIYSKPHPLAPSPNRTGSKPVINMFGEGVIIN